MDSVNDNTTLLVLSSLIRISADHGSFAAPRSFSQLVTSFFGAMYHRHPPYALCSLIFPLVYLSLHTKKILKFQLVKNGPVSAFRLYLAQYVLALTIFFALLFLVLPFVLFFVFISFFTMQLSIFYHSSTEEKGAASIDSLDIIPLLHLYVKQFFQIFSIFLLINEQETRASRVPAARPLFGLSILYNNLYNGQCRQTAKRRVFFLKRRARRPIRAARIFFTQTTYYKKLSKAVFIFSYAFSAASSSFARTE